MAQTDAGPPMQRSGRADREVRSMVFESDTRQLSIRNTGVNTLWFTFEDPEKLHPVLGDDGKPIDKRGAVWFDIACGTSWDDRVMVRRFWYRTQTGVTHFVATGVRFHPV